MGALYDFFNFVYPDHSPALEATEDITDNVEKEASNIAGDDNGVEMSDNSDGNIDTNTDDILGTKSNKDSNNNEDNSDEPKAEGFEDDNNSDLEDDMGGDDENLDDYSSDEENTDPQEIKMKVLLHKNYNYLFEILDSNISIISDYTPNTMDENIIQSMAMAKERLEECKQLISSTLKNDFKTSSYATLMKRYVGINRVHFLLTEFFSIVLAASSDTLLTISITKS